LGAAELASGSPGRALSYLKRSIALDPDNALARAYRALALHELGRTSEAQAELLWALAAAEDDEQRGRIREFVERVAEGTPNPNATTAKPGAADP
jgi:tetratricopeptide (TPR) repeat protein